jgi:hypothetical protein
MGDVIGTEGKDAVFANFEGIRPRLDRRMALLRNEVVGLAILTASPSVEVLSRFRRNRNASGISKQSAPPV